ncbi:DUF6082 family protein [Actinoplanes philippinensis]|uniref:DUF6082 family protein n=1 Tax=Actinoplanes philippinensis TaxID=35752 RepID=UPI00194116C0|nr:DUF6082 family protein [Actinoplanes philippinensis]
MIVAIAALTILAVAAVPLALGRIGRLITADRESLGNIGDSYGVVSAVFSASAFLAVAASIRYQARAFDQQRLQASRDRRLELLRLVLDDPETYASGIGRDPGSLSRDHPPGPRPRAGAREAGPAGGRRGDARPRHLRRSCCRPARRFTPTPMTGVPGATRRRRTTSTLHPDG